MKNVIYIIVVLLASCSDYTRINRNVQRHGNVPIEHYYGEEDKLENYYGEESIIVEDVVSEKRNETPIKSSSSVWIIYICILLIVLYFTYKSFSNDSKK
jgi:hypothetical protein